MQTPQCSVSWDDHKGNICHGLTILQQNGEFVDMTLAADGHLVKVHQVILALASPYIKELITAAKCPHPVVYLNKISYNTLCSILEYIYTGQTMVHVKDLKEFSEAAAGLHIRGLEDMDELSKASLNQNAQSKSNGKITIKETVEKTDRDSEDELDKAEYLEDDQHFGEIEYVNTNGLDFSTDDIVDKKPKDNVLNTSELKYSLSNQGNLQVILNRYIYNLRHCNKDSERRYWRCIDYAQKQCSASVATLDHQIVGRKKSHNHNFHDVKIIRKLQSSNIYSNISEAQAQDKFRKSHHKVSSSFRKNESAVKDIKTE